jgi:hypothetical protein
MSKRREIKASSASPESKEEKSPLRTGRAEIILRSVEWGLAILGALNCIGISILFGTSITTVTIGQQLWPLPGLYLVEISLLGLSALLAVASNRFPEPSRWSAIPWIAAGILATFFVLGGFSIGPSLAPAMLAFLIAGILQDFRQRGDWPRHFMLFMLAAILQGVVMFSLVFLLLSS